MNANLSPVHLGLYVKTKRAWYAIKPFKGHRALPIYARTGNYGYHYVRGPRAVPLFRGAG